MASRSGEPITVGVVGCGRVFERCHLPALRSSSDWRIVGAVDSSQDRIDWLGETLPRVPAFGSLTELLDTDPQAVLIAA
ncbi:MAG: Gfo/Idh/MocA family oxidoreductase, partial [Anaerolineales bacterium]